MPASSATGWKHRSPSTHFALWRALARALPDCSDPLARTMEDSGVGDRQRQFDRSRSFGGRPDLRSQPLLNRFPPTSRMGGRRRLRAHAARPALVGTRLRYRSIVAFGGRLWRLPHDALMMKP